jgi:ADP-ribose pyrophosphatase YjhB (NUDIX family)
MPGETSAQACARHLKRELGITELNASEIEHVSTQLFVWDSRFAPHSSLPCPRSIHKVL